MIKLEIKSIPNRYGLGKTIVDFDYHTQERAAVGRICGCGNCACCQTLKETNEYIPVLLKQFE